MKSVIVVGGGAAGLIAAITAARSGASVTVLEANEKPGKKLLATGNGRCNLTNMEQQPNRYRGQDSAKAWDYLKRFTAFDTLRFFSEIGIYTKNRNGWMYPNSDQAQAVLDCLLMEARYQKVKLKLKQQIVDVCWDPKGWQVKTDSWTYTADAVILACGSPASQIEGASDFGYRFARKQKLPVVSMEPALVGLRGIGDYYASWAGVRIHASVTLYLEGMPMKMEEGEVQLTDYGISGIPVFQISRYAVRGVKEHTRTEAVLDFLPDFTEEALEQHLKTRQKHCPYKSMEEQLVGLLPSKLIPLVSREASNTQELISRIKHHVVTIKGASSLSQAQVCSGGILLKALDENLQSIQYPGLYMAGEVLDVDGACGGYNLQWAWTSGAIAGSAAAKEKL
ncbi:MAG: aminoacetone oxidase family FAD-binding enzyme [Lachnospiraceae bacterium]|nr:aminoacetone oxidase family FAD-binding enzyme [Lachnospiraceae bacterium]